MRFLCLHGLGTNSQILETQTGLFPLAAIRYELGDHHTYEFVEGSIPAAMSAELAAVASADDATFAYVDFDDLRTATTAMDQLDAYIAAAPVPFDAILAFSQGATLAATWLARTAMRASGGQRPVASLAGIRCAVFFSAAGAYDASLLDKGEARLLTAEVDGEVIPIQTAHVWGKQDKSVDSESVVGVCAPDGREVYVHEGGHEIPSVRMPAAVKETVRVMRRVISRANYQGLP